MGRIFEKRKNRMFARWAKMSKAFTKIGREIAIAVRTGGPNPDSNSRLRAAIQNARIANMPKDRIDAAVNKAASKDASVMEEVFYEAYGPHGVAIFVETATDNPTRTVANVRNFITRRGGNLATKGALDFVFNRKGVFTIAKPSQDIEEFELELIDYGLEDMFETEEGDLLLYADFSSFGEMQNFLETKKVEVKQSTSQRIPVSYVDVSAELQKEVLDLIDVLEEDDDVQVVYHNLKQEE